MTGFARPCLVCGRRVDGGAARCATHENQRYAQPLGCFVCGKRGPRGYCTEHDPWLGNQPDSVRNEKQPWRAGYRSKKYRDNRKKALAIADGRCQRCNRSDQALEVDHVVPLSTARNMREVDALNELANLLVLCLSCHRAKTNRGRR